MGWFSAHTLAITSPVLLLPMHREINARLYVRPKAIPLLPTEGDLSTDKNQPGTDRHTYCARNSAQVLKLILDSDYC